MRVKKPSNTPKIYEKRGQTMGKGNRNRQNRETELQTQAVKATPKTPKKKRYRKPLSETAKNIIAGAVALVLIAAIVVGSLASAGTFKRNNILIHSKSGDYDINQQMATYMVWDALYYTGYYQWQYYSSSIKESTGITSQDEYCLAYAMSGVQETLLTSLNTYVDTLKEYVAVCDAAAGLGITVSKEELKEAEADAVEQIEYMASASNLQNTKGFLNYYIGNNVKMKDIKATARLQKLYSKVMESEQLKAENAVTDEILAKYRDENPESFYSTDYVSFATKDAALKDKLLAATSVEQFKTLIAENEFNNGNNNYKTVFNKHGTSIHENATKLEAALEKKTTADELNTAIAAQKTAEEGKTALLEETDNIASYTKGKEGLNQSVSDWLFKDGRAQFDSDIIATEDALYVVVCATAPATEGETTTATALVKTFTLSEGESYGEGEALDESFKENIYKTLLVKLELLEKAEGMKLYDETEDEVILEILEELETALEKVVPTTKTEAYKKEPEANSYQDWMFDADTLTSPVAKNAVKDFSKTEGEGDAAVTTYTVYYIEDPMKYDTSLLVNGGYLQFKGTDHATKAADFLATLNGLTGEALAAKFTANSDATVSETISEDNLADELKAWLFDPARAADNTASIAIPNTSEKESEDNSSTYVAFFTSSVPNWEYSAKNGHVNKTLTDWVAELIKDYQLDGTKWIKDKTPADTTETTAA